MPSEPLEQNGTPPTVLGSNDGSRSTTWFRGLTNEGRLVVVGAAIASREMPEKASNDIVNDANNIFLSLSLNAGDHFGTLLIVILQDAYLAVLMRNW